MKTNTSKFLLLLVLVGCGVNEPTKVKPKSEDVNRVYGTGEAVDPAKAQINLVQDAAISAPTAKSMNLSVPSFTAAFEVADHMQVMRCAKNFVFRTPDGRDAEDVTVKNVKDAENMRYAWMNALSHSSDCNLIGNRISRQDFFDLSAKSGDFFYILNPCIDTNRSIYPDVNHPQQCSYKLKFTKALNFVSTLSADVLATAQKLNEAEGKFSAMFTQMQSLAGYIQIKQKSCVQEALVDQARRTAFDAVTQLVSMAVPAVSNIVISGPIADILGVQNIFDVAKKFVLGTIGQPQINSSGTVACPVADTLQSQFQGLVGSVDGALKSVVDIRNQLSKLNGIADTIDLSMKP